MVFGGFYGGLFPVVMINVFISRLASIGFLLNDFFRLFIWLKGSSVHLHAEASENWRVASDEVDPPSDCAIAPVDKITKEIRESLTSSPFSSTAERFFCKSCAVCLSEFELSESIFQLPHCTHIFHEACLGKWLDHHQSTCPLCRSSLLTEELSRKVRDQEEELADPWWCGNYGWSRLY